MTPIGTPFMPHLGWLGRKLLGTFLHRASTKEEGPVLQKVELSAAVFARRCLTPARDDPSLNIGSGA
jgi:hypothetical protein